VLLAGVALAFQSVAVYYALGPRANDLNNAITVEVIIGFGTSIVLWLIFTGVFSVLMRLLTSRIRFGRLFKLVGWGFVPFVFAGLVWSAGRYFAFQGQTVPDGVRVGVLSSEREALQSITAGVTGDPVLVATTAVGCVFVLLSGYLWSFAVEYSSDLNRRRATLIAGVPVVLYIVRVLLRVL
jgi:hypothetical protein